MNKDQRETVRLRVVSSLKERLVRYARHRGLSQNAAAMVLLDDALERAGYAKRER